MGNEEWGMEGRENENRTIAVVLFFVYSKVFSLRVP